MSSLDQDFEELRQRIKQGCGLRNTGDDPLYYLVFRPEEMLDVKRHMKQWKAKLALDDWKVYTLSMVDAVHGIIKNNDLREIWLESEKESPLDFESINKTLSDALTADDAMKNLMLEKIEEAAKTDNGLLLVTDLEALHPYLRIGSIEQKLQGKIKVTTVILYPGKRTGRTTLKFLGIYDEDGNYRSIHIGG